MKKTIVSLLALTIATCVGCAIESHDQTDLCNGYDYPERTGGTADCEGNVLVATANACAGPPYQLQAGWTGPTTTRTDCADTGDTCTSVSCTASDEVCASALVAAGIDCWRLCASDADCDAGDVCSAIWIDAKGRSACVPASAVQR